MNQRTPSWSDNQVYAFIDVYALTGSHRVERRDELQELLLCDVAGAPGVHLVGVGRDKGGGRLGLCAGEAHFYALQCTAAT